MALRAAGWLCAALLVAGGAERTLTLRIGERVPFSPGALPAQVICDDLSVLRVEDAGDHLLLTGLRAGSTRCSFGMATAPGQRVLYRFTVVP